MNSTLPRSIMLREDGPREGFQMHSAVVPTAQKLELIRRLASTGIKSIETTSFVRPDRLPQLADAEEVAAGLPEAPGVRFRALYLNERGFRRALAAPKLNVEGYVLIAASESFLRKNSNTTIQQTIDGIERWLAAFASAKIALERVMISTAFGDYDEGKLAPERVIEICARVIAAIESAGGKLPEMTFADTTGFANPEGVKQLVSEFRSRWPEIEVGLHLHDTRGTGLANVYAGLLCGVSRFDCSVGGMGGCPFAKGAAGNVPTEDVAYMCEEMGIATGIDLQSYVACARYAEAILNRKLPGKLKDSGLFPA